MDFKIAAHSDVGIKKKDKSRLIPCEGGTDKPGKGLSVCRL